MNMNAYDTWMASDYKMGIISIEFDGRWTDNVDVWGKLYKNLNRII